MSYDVIIAGLGALGSAALLHLVRRGARVLGLDRFHPPHSFGSSHGRTRIIREAYFEHPAYVPLVQRAYELWADLEARSGRVLLQKTGGLMIGPPEGALVTGAVQSARQHRLEYQSLGADEVRRRFPGLRPSPEMEAVWEPRAGVLFPEQCVETNLQLAEQAGAELHFETAVWNWAEDENRATVRTSAGEFEGARLLLSAGSWIPELMGAAARPGAPGEAFPWAVERQIQFWFEPAERPLYHPERCPIHLWEHAPGRYFYGFPDLGEGVKVAIHHEGEPATPESINREVSEAEVDRMRALVRRFLPQADGPLRFAQVCSYTNTPDGHFLLDWHPEHPRVFIGSACSGHGFKFSIALGEMVAGLLSGEASPFDLSLFRWRRPVR